MRGTLFITQPTERRPVSLLGLITRIVILTGVLALMSG